MAKSKKKTKQDRIVWSTAPAAHDYPAAEQYLELIARPAQAAVLASLLSQASTIQRHAKDILRAARLPLLAADDHEVTKDLKRIADGVALSPVLLVRGDVRSGVALQIADGYHRVCASYHVQEDTEIPCRIVDLPVVEAATGSG